MRIVDRLVLFSIYFFFTTVIVNFIWLTFVEGELYNCTDPFLFPFFMFPPYAHEGVPGDYYAAPKEFVDTLGVSFIFLNFSVPLIGLILTPKRFRDKF